MSDRRVVIDLDLVDWELLSRQKQALVKLLWGNPDDLMWGLVHLVDHIQCAASDQGHPVVWLQDDEITEKENTMDLNSIPQDKIHNLPRNVSEIIYANEAEMDAFLHGLTYAGDLDVEHGSTFVRDGQHVVRVRMGD